MTSKVPSMTDDARRENLKKALEARLERAAIKNALKSGAKKPEWALEQDAAQRMYVKQFLRALPGIGNKRADQIMAELKIPEYRRISGLSAVMRDKLLWRVA